MASQRQLVGQWFLLDENSKFNSGSISDKELDKAYEKCLKDLKITKTAMPFMEFRGFWRAVLRGAFKPASHTEKAVSKAVPVSDIKLEVWSPGGQTFDKKLFQTWKTGDGIDIILSTHGGASKASTTIITGEPGVGKTTVCAAIQRKFQENYPKAKIACIQAEMKRFDIAYEFTENQMPWMKDLKYLILKDYGYSNIKNVLIKIFTGGYDIIFVDSVENIVKKLVVYSDMSHKEAENFILELFDHANDGKNNKNEKGETVYSTIFAIQQVNKDGGFKGDNALKHETTAMLHLMKDDKGNRYASHSKNRRCGKHVDKRLFYNLDDKNEVVYDIQMFAETEEQMLISKKEKEAMSESLKNFYSTFEMKGSDKEKAKTGKIDGIATEVFSEATTAAAAGTPLALSEVNDEEEDETE
jgi:RecA/RadA recombinase